MHGANIIITSWDGNGCPHLAVRVILPIILSLHSPYGIAPYPGNSSRLLVADWGSNRTVVMQVDWTTGQLKMERNLTKYSPRFLNGHTDFENDRVPYPFRLAASKDNLAVISMVCCETWQVTKIHRFTSNSTVNYDLVSRHHC